MKSIVIAYPIKNTALQIKNVLDKNGYHVSHICATGASVLRITDSMREGIVICASLLRDMSVTYLFEQLPVSFDVVAITNGEGEYFSDGIISLPLPLDISDFLSTVAVLTSSNSTFNINSRSVTNAKTVLMNLQGMSEPEAHSYLQRESMKSGRPIEDIASEIITHFKGE